MEIYPLVVFVHVLAAFAFVLAHGVSVFVALRLRSERQTERVAALLDLSRSSIGAASLALIVLFLAGIAAGFLGNHWGRLWIWVSIGLIVVLWAAMGAIGSRHFNELRLAIGLPSTYGKRDDPLPEPRPSAEVATMLASSRPYWLAAIGGGGLVLLLWLMAFQPF